MKIVLSMLLILFSTTMHEVCASETPSLNRKLLRLGHAPTEEPVRFAPALLKNVLTPEYHFELHGTPVFLPDGSQFLIEMQRKDSDAVRYHKTIMIVRFCEGSWQELEPAPFSGRWNDGTISLSPDGKRLYFSSDRPVPGHPDRQGRDLWFVKRTESGWSEPVHLNAPVNSDQLEGALVFGGNNHAYIYRRYDATDGSADVLACTIVDGAISQPTRIAGAINGPAFEFPVLASDDGGWLMFYSNRGYPETAGLYITFQDKHANWQVPQFLPPEINNLGLLFTASLSPDGDYLFLLNRQNTDKPLSAENGEQPGGIYWLHFPPLLEKLKADFGATK